MNPDDQIFYLGAAVLTVVAIREARRWFRSLPDYATTPLAPEVRPVSWPCGATSDGIPFLCTLAEGHGGWHIAQGHGEREIHRWPDPLLAAFDQAIALTRDPDPVAAQWDALHAEAVEFSAAVMATIHALPETETTS